MFICLLLVCLLSQAHSQKWKKYDNYDYNYDKKQQNHYELNYKGLAYKISTPFLILMAGTIHSSVTIHSNGFMKFGNLTIKISNSDDNVLEEINTWEASGNFTIQYKGHHHSNHNSIEWLITFYDKGFQQFLVSIQSNSTNENKLCSYSGCYQNIDYSHTLYSICGSSKCSNHLEDCTSVEHCRNQYPSCVEEGQSNCINEIALTISLSVIFGLIFVIYTCWRMFRRCSWDCCSWIGNCFGSICQCCHTLWCQWLCCCRNRHHMEDVPMPVLGAQVMGPIGPPLQPLRRGISMRQSGIELTQLHHPKTYEEIQKQQCSICMDGGVNIMTRCEHYFHWVCIKAWYERKKECPYCRQTLSQRLYQPCSICKNFVLPTKTGGLVSSLVCKKCKSSQDIPSLQMIAERSENIG